LIGKRASATSRPPNAALNHQTSQVTGIGESEHWTMRNRARNKAFVSEFALILSGAFVAVLFSSTTAWTAQSTSPNVTLSIDKTLKKSDKIN